MLTSHNSSQNRAEGVIKMAAVENWRTRRFNECSQSKTFPLGPKKSNPRDAVKQNNVVGSGGELEGEGESLNPGVHLSGRCKIMFGQEEIQQMACVHLL